MWTITFLWISENKTKQNSELQIFFIYIIHWTLLYIYYITASSESCPLKKEKMLKAISLYNSFTMTTPRTEDVVFTRLKKVTDRVCRYESHKQFLNDCVSNNIIPKGFDLQWKMDLPLNEAENG